MRKYISLFIVIFLFGLMACTQVENNIYCPTGERVNVTVVASQDDSQTKTHIGEHYSEGGYAVLWDESGESIALMERVTRNGEFSVQTVVSGDYTLSEDAKTATFMGLGLVANETSEVSTFDYVVISPSSAVNMDTENHSVVGLALPTVQKPKVDSYDPNASILVGSSLGNGEQKDVVEADLTHILAYAKMTVKNVPTDDKIETVEFITEKDIYGTVLKYNIEDGTVGSDSSIMSVKMDVSSIPQSGESFDVYFTALPTEFSPGDKFSVKVSTADRLYVKEWTMTDTKKFDLISQSVLTFSVDMEDAEVGEVEWPVPDNEIWYRTADNQKYDIYHSTNTYGHQPFDAEIVSHTYENGIGKIKCDNTITKINDSAFGNGWGHKLSELYLPETIEIIETYGIRGNEYLTTLRIPKNLKSVGSGGLNNPNLESFTGSHITEDGRCVIIEDGFMPNYGDTQTPVKNYLAAFAPAGITEYTLPDNVEILGWYAFAWCPELPKITFNEGLKTIMGDCFYESHLDCEIILPSTLENLDPYAFHSCSGIKGFYGNEKFHTSDHLCLIFEQTAYCDQPEKNGIWINRFVGYDITDYSIPEGIKGIENYSRVLSGRPAGSTPYTLMDYFPDDYVLFVDESHVTLPQVRGMYGGDRARKENLVEYGFRLPSAFDNRPLNFDEFYSHIKQAVFVSATPGDFEKDRATQIVEQVIRPTGLLDTIIEVRPVEGQIDDLIGEINARAKNDERVLVTTLTKRMAEELDEYLRRYGVRSAYIHSDIDTLERVQIMEDLRRGIYDVLVGVNLLREGLDLPEVSLVAILATMFGERLMLYVVGAVSGRNDACNTIWHIKLLYFSLIIILLLPLLILVLLTEGVVARLALYTSIAVCSLTLILFVKETFLLFRAQRFSIFHWFLYLCALEIFPVSLILAPILR